MSLVIDLIDLVAKHKAGELRCPATALIQSVGMLNPKSANQISLGSRKTKGTTALQSMILLKYMVDPNSRINHRKP